jgi:hypothetical protein
MFKTTLTALAAVALSGPAMADPMPHLKAYDENRCARVGNNPACLAEMAKIEQFLTRSAQSWWNTADADTRAKCAAKTNMYGDMINCLQGPDTRPATATAKPGELDGMIKSGDAQVMREYLQAQADAGKIEPTFDIDAAYNSVDVSFMGPYIHDDAKVPDLDMAKAIGSQDLARQWGRAFCDAAERSQRQRGTVATWTVTVNAWYIGAPNAKPHSIEAISGYDVVLKCELGAAYKVTIVNSQPQVKS